MRSLNLQFYLLRKTYQQLWNNDNKHDLIMYPTVSSNHVAN